MQRHRPTPSRRQPRARLLGGSCLLLLYLAATPVAPALTALMAAADRDHHVAIEQTDHGLRVVLHHDCSSAPTHRHKMVARVLTLFAQRTTPAQLDHVIQFGTTDTVRESASIALETKSCSTALDTFPAHQLPQRGSGAHYSPAGFARPPPVASGVLLALRSTVLLV